MAVNVTLRPVFKASSPQLLFQAPLERSGKQGLLDTFSWDVTSDGKRFLINTTKATSGPITVVLNWDTELPKR